MLPPEGRFWTSMLPPNRDITPAAIERPRPVSRVLLSV